jgi:hypothetical protein
MIGTETLSLVESALPFSGGLKPREVCKKILSTSPGYVRAALLQLVREGRAARDGEDGKKLYWRVAREAAE